MGLFDGQSENSFKYQDDDGDGEIPKPRIIFDGNYSINGNDTMCRKDQPSYDSLDGIYETHFKRLKSKRKGRESAKAKANVYFFSCDFDGGVGVGVGVGGGDEDCIFS